MTFINLWFAECQPCINEISHLNKLKEEFDDKVEFVSVCRYDIQQEFIDKHAYNFRHLKVNKDSVEYWFPNVGYPTNYIEDRNSKIIYVIKGVVNKPKEIAVWNNKIKAVFNSQLK